MVKLVDAAWLAQRIGSFPELVLVLDARAADQYSDGYISGSVNVCNGIIFSRRLRKGTLKMESVLNIDEDKVKYIQAKESEMYTVVVCDHNSSSSDSLPSDSIAYLLLKKVSRECKHVAFLTGGYQQFCSVYSDLCDVPCSTPTDNLGLLQNRPSSLVLQLNNLSITRRHTIESLSLGSPMEVATESEEDDSPSAIIPPFEILPHLYLGCRKVAVCLPGLRESNVTRILNVTSTIPNHYQSLDGFLYKQIPVEDNHDVDMIQHLPDAFRFIEEAKACGEKVLVHCHAGMSRSVTVILAYLMKYYSHTLESAHEFVKQVKSNISPNFSFMGQLLDYECSLRPSPSDSGFGSSPVEGHYFLHSPAL